MPNIRLKEATDFSKPHIVPNAVLHSDLMSYFNDTTPEAGILAEQLMEFNEYKKFIWKG